MDSSQWYAHSANAEGRWQTMREHLEGVAIRAEQFAKAFGAEEEARLTGLLHDVGKYSPLFLKRLKGEVGALDHWSAGAWIAVTHYKSAAAALAIAGHHVGLEDGTVGGLRKLDPARLALNHPLGLRLSEEDTKALLARMHKDGINPEPPNSLLLPELGSTAAHMLDVRMLFSALVDADFLDTQEHHVKERAAASDLDAKSALASLASYVKLVERSSKADAGVNRVRRQLMEWCTEAGRLLRGLVTLNAPTGSGKTLAMLRFALEQADAFGLRRIIYVAPYLSIIEQTAQTFREALHSCAADNLILEDHSLSGARGSGARGGGDLVDGQERRLREITENWDAPFILTTTVQILESLFANQNRPCRKLHRIAQSVILFDEAQNLPVHLVVPTLTSLARLVERFGVTVLFATATQPAFHRFDAEVSKATCIGWRPREIVPNPHRLFQGLRRVYIKWPRVDAGRAVPTSWEEICGRLTDERQIACVVNMKRHAVRLANALKDACTEGVFHLSTNMCPAHRMHVLREIQRLLGEGAPCRLVSTQCIEAGVDVDFPVVLRAFGPLEAIAQAAGRCNRNGKLDKGRVEVFWPEPDEGKQFPSTFYEHAATEALYLLGELGPEHMDICDPALFTRYYTALYDVTRPETMREELLQAIKDQNFKEVARLYRVIEQDPINVLVPYGPNMADYEALADEVRRNGITARWIRRARRFSVSLFKPRPNDPVCGFLEPVPIVGGQTSDDWFIWSRAQDYDDLLGLLVPAETATLIA